MGSKFTIEITKGGRILMMDALSAFLRAHGDPQSEKVLAQLQSEEYDSQSVEIDLSLETGNICDLRADIRRFLRDFNIGGRSFATGINFEYHHYVIRPSEEQTEDQEGFGVIPRSDLFVRARFDSLKNEILSSQFLSVSDFEEFVTEKTNKYLVTDDCKAIKCKEMEDNLHFGIKGPTWNG